MLVTCSRGTDFASSHFGTWARILFESLSFLSNRSIPESFVKFRVGHVYDNTLRVKFFSRTLLYSFILYSFRVVKTEHK